MNLLSGPFRGLWLLPLLLALSIDTEATAISKRGLCFVPNSTTPQDDYIWTKGPSALTWYYNYASLPSPVFHNITQDKFEFVPMLWGAPAHDNDTSFLETVQAMVRNGTDIRNVLTFNEPEISQYGGSGVDPAFGARVWVNNIIPLQRMGIRAGLPGPTGSTDGLPWLREFLGNCSEITGADCVYDFVTLHWYGNFEGLASHIGEYAATWVPPLSPLQTPPGCFMGMLRLHRFPHASIWVTEYNLDHQSLRETQSFYNTSTKYLDGLLYIERYSLFGAFRSSVSNVGPNAAMLSSEGNLTDIGRWYLGRDKDYDKDVPDGMAPLVGLSVVCMLLPVALVTVIVILM